MTDTSTSSDELDTTDRGLARLTRRANHDGPGAGALVLLVHGTMDRASSFRRVMRHLNDFDVVSYDRRGYAGSAAVAGSDDLGDQVDDLLDVVDGRQVLAFGHSLGGAVVLAAAQRRPDLLDSVVVYETPQPWRPWWPRNTTSGGGLAPTQDPAESAEVFMRRMIGDRVWRALPEATRQARRSEGAALQSKMRALRKGLAYDPATITVPVVVGRGERGSRHQREGSQELAGELPDAVLVDVPGADHSVHLSHPRDLAELLRLGLTRRRG